MNENLVASILKDFAARLWAEQDRHYGVTSRLMAELNEALPPGWEGFISSNAVSANQAIPDDKHPDVTGRPIILKRFVIYQHDQITVREQKITKYPSDCCAYCGTPRVYFTGWECPVCGAV